MTKCKTDLLTVAESTPLADFPASDLPLAPAEQGAAAQWEVDGVTLFRAMGYVVGLLAFFVGTALCMLGFSLSSGGLVRAACMLYSIALTAMGGRIVLTRINPSHESQAAWIAVGALLSAGAIFALLTTLLWLFDLPGGFD